MRTRSHTPPPPLPPILDNLATVLPLPKKAYRSQDDDAVDVPLQDLDPETSRLIAQPTKRWTHKVWVQGRLAAVRSVSKSRKGGSGNGRTPTAGAKDGGVTNPDLVSGVTSTASSSDMEEVGEDHEGERETTRRARQLRGYGIGGIGNIRRPTDVIYGPNRPATYSRSQPDISSRGAHGSPLASPTEEPKWNLRDFLALRADNKGKGRGM